eukprot:TRINITY_DN8615_c0_g1_i1.p1 TRINITY_DN8615_c0_g1~~TRINITY_DN8615_c0_g1_i1.p1  ORF type:complete len:316 (-),score=39.28 TRINITY_DN8615_c0_g1_i1:94-1041(-)
MDRSTEFTLLLKNYISYHPEFVHVICEEDILQNKFISLGKVLCERLTHLQNYLSELSPQLSDPKNFLQKLKPSEIIRQDKLDHENRKCIQNCHKMITEYLESLDATEITSPQVKLYFNNTIYLIESILSQRINTFTKMRSQRHDKLQRVKNASRLLFHLNTRHTFDGEEPHQPTRHSNLVQTSPNIRHRQTNATNATSNVALEEFNVTRKEEINLVQENVQLVREMKREYNEIQSIQTKLTEISQLQHIFAEEVLKQKEELEVIADMTEISALNISEGNKNIRKAIQKQFTSDGIVLFIIIMFTIALWFLDWYQD